MLSPAGKARFAMGLVAAATGLLLACGGPIVPHSPEAVYALAQEQIANANYSPAVDTLNRVVRESPGGEPARRAHVLRLALLAGMARGFEEIAESYLAGHMQAGAAPHAAQMRAVAMDYFGRARGRSISLVESLEALVQEPPTGTFRVDSLRLSDRRAPEDLLARVRQGGWVEPDRLQQTEKDMVGRQLTQVLAALGGAGNEVEPAAFFLAMGEEMVQLSRIYRPEALGDRRMFRLFHERAATTASQAARLARTRGDQRVERESERLAAYCQDVLAQL
jgi:hypothetical protein